MAQQTIPEINVGGWTFTEEAGGGGPALLYRGSEVRAGHTLGPAELAKMAKDLMKLAGQLAAAGY
jgi:hypothetical protein